MKRAGEEEPTATAPVKKPKLDMAALRAKLAKTKEKVQTIKGRSGGRESVRTESAAEAPIQLEDESIHVRSRRRNVVNLFQDGAVPREHRAAARAAPAAAGGTEGRDDGSEDSEPEPAPPVVSHTIPLISLPPVPDMEWWDKRVLDQDSYDVSSPSGDLHFKVPLNCLVEHPVLIEPPAEKTMPAPQALKLTKKELKKIRRQRREEREKEKQLNIQTGLMEPPQPKVRLSNMARVYGADGVIDATAIEKKVREAQAERQAAHDDRNLARKLTTEERSRKKLAKLFDDSAPDTHVQVFRINKLDNGKNQYKVEINATENRLTGVCIVAEHGFNIVVVEGDPKGLRRFSRLMLHRIDWNAMLHVEGADEDDIFGDVNRCHVVWQGTVASPAFDTFTKHNVTGPFDARQLLAERGVAHYWDAAEHFIPTAEAELAV